MATYIEQECPLCDSSAVYCWVDARNVKYYECVHCGMFQISKRAESLLLAEFPSRRAIYSAHVKNTPPEHLLFIRMPSREFREKNDDRLEAGYLPKSELSLD